MKKSILIAIGMAIGLFAFGYILSTAGHDHSNHHGEAGHHDTHEDGADHHH
ncbi:MAG: hypothetical protein H6756_02425 [Candidatus Omnitrophica bacterium]|nr:hypothetical protein [Candidatus Omnitrophota bacterium]